jgi:hypothetical protein
MTARTLAIVEGAWLILGFGLLVAALAGAALGLL